MRSSITLPSWFRRARVADITSVVAIALLVYSSVESLFRAVNGKAVPIAPGAEVIPPSLSAMGSAAGLIAVPLAAVFLLPPAHIRTAPTLVVRGLVIALGAAASAVGVALMVDDWGQLGTADIGKHAAVYAFLVWIYLIPAGIYCVRAKRPRRLVIAGLAAFGLSLQMLSLIMTAIYESVAFLIRTARRAAGRAI